MTEACGKYDAICSRRYVAMKKLLLANSAVDGASVGEREVKREFADIEDPGSKV